MALTTRLVRTLLERPDLVEHVRRLSNGQVTGLINQVGLEDAGELLALLSRDQLTLLLDDVLWDEPGCVSESEFDVGRFATWLEVMCEAGDDFAADRLAELSDELLTLGVSRMAHVIDVSLVQRTALAADADLVDKLLDSAAVLELRDFLLVSRHPHGWDSFVGSLTSLDARHSAVLDAVLHRCWLGQADQLDDSDSLVELLHTGDAVELDALAERDTRRAQRGFVSPADARAFLALAATEQPIEPGQRDAITGAYFRELSPNAAQSHITVPGAPAPSVSPVSHGGLPQLLWELLELDPAKHERQLEELAFLTNALVSGDRTRSVPWRPVEAAQRAVEVCEVGLKKLANAPPNVHDLQRWGLVAAFRAGFSVPT